MKKKNSMSTHQKGKWGEERAAAYLMMKGYRVLERNYRVSQGEIDLIASRNGTVVFVEVKSRRGKLQGSPLEAVSPRKVGRLSAAAAVYLSRQPETPKACRFDVVTLGPEKNWMGLAKIRHVENAFSASENFNI